jgi:hypothetical protein
MKDRDSREVLALARMFPERGRINAIRDRVAAIVGYQLTDRYMPIEPTDGISSDHHSHAMLENNDMTEGQPVIVGADQPHVIHLSIHVRPMTQAAKAFRENPGRFPVERIIPDWQQRIPHCLKHIEFLEQDPLRKQHAEEFNEIIDTLEQVFRDMLKVARRRQQVNQQQREQQQKVLQQAAAREQNTDLQAKLTELQEKMRIREMDVRNQMELRTMKALAKMQLDRQKAQTDAAIEMRRELQEA